MTVSMLLRYARGMGLGLGLAVGLSTSGNLAAAEPAAAGQPTIAEGSPAGGASAKPVDPPKFPEWDTVLKGTTKISGLFNLHYNQKEQKLFLEIGSDQLDRDLLCPISIARGAGGMFLGGDTLNFGDQWVLSFKRAGDRILVIRRNIYFKAREGTPQADAVKVSYNDSVIASLSVRSEQGGRVIVDAAELFMTDLANIGVRPDPSRSTWGAVKAFDGNIGIEVNAVFPLGFGGFFFLFGGGPEIPDARGTQVVMHYGLSMLPTSNGYQTRAADDRVGHFLSVLKDFSTDSDKSALVHYVTRWRLEKSDASAAKSTPREPIIFWIEKTVPREYRPYVKAGILEWNKAFEKIGFIDAIQVRDQLPTDDFDPEDIRYNTFRWITTASAFAMGPSRTNPLTGQILDADILFDEAMVRYWRQEYLRLAGVPKGMELLENGQQKVWLKLFAADLPILAGMEPIMAELQKHREAERTKAEQGPPPPPALRTMAGWPHRHGAHESCSFGPGMTRQLGLMAAMMSLNGTAAAGGKVPEEFIGQAIKEVTMHEVGHTLGLRHNFKASAMLKLEDCHNTDITSQKGMAGSVMDYLPANIARKGQKQGHYFSPTIGPYDYWAIEYAYKPISGNEGEELGKIASRVAEPELAFGTDEDLYGSPDPRINLYDLGDPLEYAKHQMLLVEESLSDLSDRVVVDGEGWQRAREAFLLLLGEYAQATSLATQYIGGEHAYRDHRGDPNGRPAYEVIPLAKQREAIALLKEHVLSDKALVVPPELLTRMAPDYWSDWESFGPSPAYPLADRILGIQQIVLGQFLSGGTLSQIQTIEKHVAPGTDVLKMPEVFDALDDAIWSELPAANAELADGKIEVSAARRALQRAHYLRLARMVLGPKASGGSMFVSGGMIFTSEGGGGSVPADAKALARLHLKQLLGRIERVLNPKVKQADGTEVSKNIELDAYSRAHLEELAGQIRKVLDAQVESNEA